LFELALHDALALVCDSPELMDLTSTHLRLGDPQFGPHVVIGHLLFNWYRLDDLTPSEETRLCVSDAIDRLVAYSKEALPAGDLETAEKLWLTELRKRVQK